MQALLLATGESKKLAPLTTNIPTPMVPIANRPAMSYAVELLARQGIQKIHVSLHQLAGSVEGYFGNGERWGTELTYLLQREAWGTAGALKWAAEQLTETFIVLPADMLIDLDIAQLVAQHRMWGSEATAVVIQKSKTEALQPIDSTEPLCVDSGGCLTTHSQDVRYGTGVYIFEPSVLDYIPNRESFDIYDHLMPALMDAGVRVHTFTTTSYVNTLRSFSHYQEAQRVILHNPEQGQAANGTPALRYLALNGRKIADGIWVGHNNVIHPSARLAPPVYIGENCRIGAGAEIGPDVVIGTNVIIDDEASVQQSTILDHTYVGQLVNIADRLVNKSLIVDTNTSESLQIEDRFLVGSTYETVAEGGMQRLTDTVVTVPILLLLLPLLAVISLFTLLTSGRVLQREIRFKPHFSGNDMLLRPFILWRFYTRHKNGRFAPLGRLLERLDWHRFPELWNVLKRDLTLVGVKPLAQTEIDQLDETWQSKRHDAPIGFTGLWYCQDNQELDDMFIADVYYIATRNWREDWKLLWQTPVAWWQRLVNTNKNLRSKE